MTNTDSPSLAPSPNSPSSPLPFPPSLSVECGTFEEQEEGKRERRINEIEKQEEEEEGGWFDEFDCRSTLLVFSAFTQQFVLIGNLYSWGVFQTELQNELGISPAKISLIGGIAAGALPLGGLMVGSLCDRFGRRPVVVVGVILVSFGLLVASFTQRWLVLCLFQGLVCGIGMSCSYFATTTSVPSWFDKRRGVATGMALAGSGVGGFVFAPLIAFLFSVYERPVVTRILVLINLSLLIPSAPFIMSKQEYDAKQEKKRKNDVSSSPSSSPSSPSSSSSSSSRSHLSIMETLFFFFSLFRDPVFVSLAVGFFFLAFGYLTPLYFLPNYVISLGFDEEFGALMVGVMNLCSAIGRVSSGQLGDKLGFLTTLLCCMSTATVAMFSWAFCTTKFTITCFSVCFGLGVGGFVSLLPTTIAEIWGTENLGSMMGPLFSVFGIGNIAGPVICGWLIQKYEPSYIPVTIASALFFLLEVISLIVTQYLLTRAHSIDVVGGVDEDKEGGVEVSLEDVSLENVVEMDLEDVNSENVNMEKEIVQVSLEKEI